VNDRLKHLIALQNTDSQILSKRTFIEKVPKRIFEVDEPLKKAQAELEKIRQKSRDIAKKRKEQEEYLEDVNAKVSKMKSRVSEIKTNKEYQAHLKEIESFQQEVSALEENILVLMEELDNSVQQEKEKEEKVNREVERINQFKKELDAEVKLHEKGLAELHNEREKHISAIDRDTYNTYMTLIDTQHGVAVTRAKNEICLGCNMHVPPQLFVELKKNEDIIQCPQCRRILYYSEEQ
jgi:predicted  nucleic acid-binding Zn-ribbon protein